MKIFGASDRDFTAYGYGPLPDALSADVTEEENGMFVLEMVYKRNGFNSGRLIAGNIIFCKARPSDTIGEPFRIYEISDGIDRTMNVKANHISYDAAYEVFTGVPNTTVTGIQAACNALNYYKLGDDFIRVWYLGIDENEPVVFDIGSVKMLSEALSGSGSLLEAFGGQYMYRYRTDLQKELIYLCKRRGVDRDITIQYGWNMTTFERDTNVTEQITEIVAYIEKEESGVISRRTESFDFAPSAPVTRRMLVDLTDIVAYTATRIEIQAALIEQLGGPIQVIRRTMKAESIDTTVVPTSQFGIDEKQLNLCDTVRVVYPELGVDVRLPVTKVVYNVLTDHYDSVELGKIRKNVADTIAELETGKETEDTAPEGPRIVIDYTPYLKRDTPVNAGLEELQKIVGGTVCYNQLAPYIETGKWNVVTADSYTLSSGVATVHKNSSTGGQCNLTIASAQRQTSIAGHKYLFAYMAQTTNGKISLIPTSAAADGQTVYAEIPNRSEKTFIWQCGVDKPITCAFRGYTGSGVTSEIDFSIENVECFDLTQMFGSTIADYIAGLEQAEDGTGAAWLRAWMGSGWHATEAGTLLSVKTSAHVTKDANATVIGDYPLDGNVELHGILRLNAANELWYDGDEYQADGTVTRNFALRAYTSGDATDGVDMITDGTNTVYRRTTPTTETAAVYMQTQMCDPNGTEEFMDGRVVEMPVGHVTDYYVTE